MLYVIIRVVQAVTLTLLQAIKTPHLLSPTRRFCFVLHGQGITRD